MGTTSQPPYRIAIIGAGPSGLVTLKYLKEVDKHFLAQAGGRAYIRVSLYHWRHIRTEVSWYCDEFQLGPSIYLNTKITRLERDQKKGATGGGNAGHVVHYFAADGVAERWECDAVAICSGLHVEPNIPDIKGTENVSVRMHSSNFKARKQFGEDKNVLILGSGETGMDLAYLAITSPTNSVTLCHRDGFCSAPKRFPNPYVKGKPTSSWELPPTDVSSPSLFDSSYVHPVLRDSILLWTYYDRWLKWSMWLISGSIYGIDQHVGGISDEKYHASKMFPNKSSKAMPYITAPYRPTAPGYQKRAAIINVPLPPTNGKVIDLAPWPTDIDSSGVVHFTPTSRPEYKRIREKNVEPDVVIYATGYTQTFPFLDATYPTPKQADMRRIFSSSDPTIGYIGFVRPGFGAIPPISEMQAQLWIMQLLAPTRLPRPLKYEDHYRLRRPEDSRIDYGVDYESYVYQLALDIGNAPGFLDVVPMGWKTLLTRALGGNLITKFRLVGPWKWEGAQQVMETEVWDTVTRRSNYSHLTLTLIPMCIFGPLSALCFVVFGVWDLVKSLWFMLASVR